MAQPIFILTEPLVATSLPLIDLPPDHSDPFDLFSISVTLSFPVHLIRRPTICYFLFLLLFSCFLLIPSFSFLFCWLTKGVGFLFFWTFRENAIVQMFSYLWLVAPAFPIQTRTSRTIALACLCESRFHKSQLHILDPGHQLCGILHWVKMDYCTRLRKSILCTWEYNCCSLHNSPKAACILRKSAILLLECVLLESNWFIDIQ